MIPSPSSVSFSLSQRWPGANSVISGILITRFGVYRQILKSWIISLVVFLDKQITANFASLSLNNPDY